MRSVLHVISDLNPGGAARQLSLLAANLPRDHFQSHVCVLGGEAPWSDEIRRVGVEVETLHWHRPFDLVPFFTLRRRLKSLRPEVIHAWGASALKVLSCLGVRDDSRLIVSAGLPPARRPGWLERWLLRRASVVTAGNTGEAGSLRLLGVASKRIIMIAPAVAADEEVMQEATPLVPSGKRMVVVVGPLLKHKGCIEAVWAEDVLHYLYDDLHLVFVGDGPERLPTLAFARSLRSQSRVHFTGPVVNVWPWLRQAAVVWVPGRCGGNTATLEALAAGRPVVATRVPGRADLVTDGVNGYLIGAGDKTALARQTRILLDDAERRRSFGIEGQRTAAAFTVECVVKAFTDLYS